MSKQLIFVLIAIALIGVVLVFRGSIYRGLRSLLPSRADIQIETRLTSEVPDSLPDHFTLGLHSKPDGLAWMKESGIPWDYRYTYLSSGVNTGEGWATWNSPPGRYATLYLNASDSAGYTPVFTYYMLAQSKPHPVDGQPDVNLNNASTMKAYYEDWKLLMQKIGEFGKLTVVHVEPDLWGYMQRQHGPDPAKTAVAVASSGFAEAAGYPDNAIGFAQVLVRLRDTYAPNALLAWNASNWAAGDDVDWSGSRPAAQGKAVADFFLALMANFDLIFFDPSDRTAGYYQYVEHNNKHWWSDAAFERQRKYIAVITTLTGRRAMLWQVPIGNTLYKSSNNTRYHYQDNRVQYFLEQGNKFHISDYAEAGVIGILFGSGTSGDTSNYDAAGDGITNQEPVNGNTLQAEYADDDGGFLRLSAQAYYSAGMLSLPGKE